MSQRPIPLTIASVEEIKLSLLRSMGLNNPVFEIVQEEGKFSMILDLKEQVEGRIRQAKFTFNFVHASGRWCFAGLKADMATEIDLEASTAVGLNQYQADIKVANANVAWVRRRAANWLKLFRWPTPRI